MSEAGTIKAILREPEVWHSREVDLTGWCLRAFQLGCFSEKLDETLSWVPRLGARRSPHEGVYLDLEGDMLRLFEAVAVHLDDLWTADLRHKWPGDPKIAKLRVRGEVVYQPIPQGHIFIGYHERTIIRPSAVEPLFEGIIELNDYWHSRDAVLSS